MGELGGFGIDPADKRTMWEEALEVSIRCMIEEPFTGFKGQHIEMPPRNVVPKPLQKPHPPVWVACTRPASVQMAAQRGLGALSFAYTGPGPLTERVNGYYKEFEENGAPVTPQMNPNILAIGGDLSMMVAPTDEQAVERLGMGGGFFAFGIMHYYMTGMHTPGRTGVWKRHLEEIEKDPTVVYGPGRGPIGSPATVREFLRGYEESGVDELILLLTPRTHDATMESIELMGKQVLPEFIERDEKAVAEKAKRLEPIIEKAEARRPALEGPGVRRELRIRRSAHRARKLHRQRGVPGDGRNERRNRSGGCETQVRRRAGRAGTLPRTWEHRMTQTRNEPWDRLTSCGATTGGASWSPGARPASVHHVARQLTELGAEVVGLDLKRPAMQLKEFHEIDLSDPASIDQAVAAIGGQVDALFNIAGVSSGIGDPLRVVTINFLGTRHFTEALIPSMPPGSAIANVSSLAGSEYRDQRRGHRGAAGHRDNGRGNRMVSAQSGAGRRRRRLPAVEGGDHPLRDGQRRRAGRQGYSDQLHRTGCHRHADPRPTAHRLRTRSSWTLSGRRSAASRARTNRRASWCSSTAGRRHYITGQVIWVDGGAVAEKVFGDVSDAREVERRRGRPWPA